MSDNTNQKNGENLQETSDSLNNNATYNKPAVSVCIVVKDEEQFLDDCLNNVKDIAEEIIIIDTESKDQSVNIAKKYTDKIYTRPDAGFYGIHRQFSIDQASCPWILILNPDESLDLPLKSNINQLVSSDFDIFLIPIKESAFNPEGADNVEARLFKKDAITWSQTKISQPVFHSNKTARINDGYILRSKSNMDRNTQHNNNHCKDNIAHDRHFNLVSHLEKLERDNTRLEDNEAMYRFLYEISRI